MFSRFLMVHLSSKSAIVCSGKFPFFVCSTKFRRWLVEFNKGIIIINEVVYFMASVSQNFEPVRDPF